MWRKRKMWRKLGNFGKDVSKNAEAISFNFDMWTSVYVRKKYKFGRNWLSSFGDT